MNARREPSFFMGGEEVSSKDVARTEGFGEEMIKQIQIFFCNKKAVF